MTIMRTLRQRSKRHSTRRRPAEVGREGGGDKRLQRFGVQHTVAEVVVGGGGGRQAMRGGQQGRAADGGQRFDAYARARAHTHTHARTHT